MRWAPLFTLCEKGIGVDDLWSQKPPLLPGKSWERRSSRGIFGFSVYALYKYELYKYNVERRGVLNDAIIHAQLSAKVAMQSLPKNVDPEVSLKVYNSTFKETLQAIMSDWDSANYPWPRWRKSATFESDSTTFKATQDSAGNTTLEGKYRGTPKASSNRGFAEGGLEEGKK